MVIVYLNPGEFRVDAVGGGGLILDVRPETRISTCSQATFPDLRRSQMKCMVTAPRCRRESARGGCVDPASLVIDRAAEGVPVNEASNPSV